MESLVNYGSDDESGDYNDSGKNELRSRQRSEEDANYDEIGMDESSEESNNNHEESHFPSLTKDKQAEFSRQYEDFKQVGFEENYDESNFELDSESNSRNQNDGSHQNNFNQINEKQEREKWENNKEGRNKCNPDYLAGAKYEQNLKKNLMNIPKSKAEKYEEINEHVTYSLACGTKKNEESQRRHSSDMEMDDGEDDLNNYNCQETAADFRQKVSQKSINFTKGKSLGEDFERKYDDSYQDFEIKGRSLSDQMSPKDTRGVEKSFDENQRSVDEKMRPRERKKDSEERRKDDYKRKDDRESRKREDERSRENDRERRREIDKYREDRDRKRTPDRREHIRKRSHSPDRRDRDRDYDRDRDRERDRERDRDRDHRSGDRRSPKHSRRCSRSPERSWKARKLEKKAAVLNKLGIELKTDVSGNLTPRQLLGEQLKAQIQEVEAKTGVTLPTYYNPGVMNPLKYAQQIQKRKLLWGNKANEAKTNEGASQGTSVSSTVKQWEAATFKGDSDGKMTEKFKRLMGIKGDAAAGNSTTSGSKPSETKEIIQKQEEMFSNMEAQYQVARMATHTHRGVGLGFGTFQVPPR